MRGRLARVRARSTLHRRARAALFDAAGAVTPLIGVETKVGTFVVDTTDPHVSRSLFVKRSRKELAVLRRALALLDELGGVRRGVFVDVGANIGTTTLAAVRSGFAEAVALEPDARNCRLLRMNVAANGAEAAVRTLELAASDTVGVAGLDVTSPKSGLPTLAPPKGRPEGRRVVPVATTTLDRLAAEGIVPAERVGLLWIDVEGHEARVLAGAQRLVERGVPVVFELNPSALHRAGDLDALAGRVAEHYDLVVSLRPAPGGALPAPLPARGGVERLAAAYGGSFGDVLAYRTPASPRAGRKTPL